MRLAVHIEYISREKETECESERKRERERERERERKKENISRKYLYRMAHQIYRK